MIFYIIIIIVLIIDIITKFLATDLFQKNFPILWDYFYLKYVENYGIAFSINIPFLKILTIILIIMIFYYYFKEEKKKKNRIIDLAFWLILWWAIWNGIERIFNWKVIDFIWVKYFAIFNFADIFISLWIFILVINILKNNK